MKLSITLLDLEKTPSGGHKFLPSVSSFDDVPELKMIRDISLGHFYNQNEANELLAKFPKSYKPRLSSGYEWDDINKKTLFDKPFWTVYFNFNFLFTNKTTGEENESAMNRLYKVIKKIKEILI